MKSLVEGWGKKRRNDGWKGGRSVNEFKGDTWKDGRSADEFKERDDNKPPLLSSHFASF